MTVFKFFIQELLRNRTLKYSRQVTKLIKIHVTPNKLMDLTFPSKYQAIEIKIS